MSKPSMGSQNIACADPARLHFKALCGWLQTGEAADVEKYSKRTIRVTQTHNDECKKLLRLMGVPVIEVAPLLYL